MKKIKELWNKTPDMILMMFLIIPGVLLFNIAFGLIIGMVINTEVGEVAAVALTIGQCAYIIYKSIEI